MARLCLRRADPIGVEFAMAWGQIGTDKSFSEPPFAPADGAKAQDDGDLVGFMWDAATQVSFMTIFDAHDGSSCCAELSARRPGAPSPGV